MKNIRKQIQIISQTFLMLSAIASSVGVYADDTEVFYSKNASKPNVLFTLDTSNSMDKEIPGTNVKRITALKQSFRKVLETAPDNVNIGVMAFGYGQGMKSNKTEDKRHHAVAGVAFPVTDINLKARDIIKPSDDLHGLPRYPTENQTIRHYLPEVADSWDLALGTPIVDSLYEAALYFRGEKIHYGQDLPEKNGAHPSTYTGNVVTKDVQVHGRDRSSAPKYNTPITNRCQSNYIVMMTDGAPWYKYGNNKDNNGNQVRGGKQPSPFSLRNKTPKGGPQGALASAIGACASVDEGRKAGECGPEITHYIANNDNLPDPSDDFPDGQEGDQFIQTFTIGFGIEEESTTEDYLKSLATYDDDDDSTVNDGYFLASTAEELAATFETILAEITAPKNTLASPGYSVNVKNGLEHEKDIYIPVFDRKNSSRWSGNLKKFKIVDDNGKRRIQGKNELNATDELGNFTPEALDYWSTSPNSNPDGKEVASGGVANLLDPDERNIFSNLSGATTNVDLSDAANEVDVDNITNLTNEVLGLSENSDQDYRERIVNFMRGWVNGETDSNAKPAPRKRFHMGDMLHSEPLIMTYNVGSGAELTGKEQYVFAGTNEGYLHAFDAKTGEEKFAFIPADLLKTLSEPQFLNAGTQEDHKYGIDGAITGDFNGGLDGTLDDGDQIIIYFGMRRGGTAYYALDVTDIDNPVLLWKKSAADHPTMGQSWSTPYVATVGEGDDTQPVVIVSAGYDDDEDRDLPNSLTLDGAKIGQKVTADVGKDILIFDTDGDDAGRLVWSMTDDMRNQLSSSIAGGIKPLDTNNNGLVDRIYFGDTGGNVWRLDLSEYIGDSEAPSVLTKLASLGGTGADNRMFFNEPDVALMKLHGRLVYAVSIGSGFRAHPMDRTINDKFYVLIDNAPFAPLISTGDNAHTEITESTLASITVAGDGGLTRSGSIADVDKRGWVISFPANGEKVLGDAKAINGSIIFPTLVPQVLSSGVGIDPCAAPVIYSRIYAVDILTGTAKWDFDEDGTPEIFTPPATTEIISSIDTIFTEPKPKAPILGEDGKPTGETQCSHAVDIRVGKKSSQLSGYNACRLESVYWSDPVAN